MSLTQRGLAWRPLLWVAAAAALGLGLWWLPLRAAVALVGAFVVLLLGAAILVQPLVGLGLAVLTGPFGAYESLLLGGGSLIDSGQLLLLLTLLAWSARGLARGAVWLPRSRLVAWLLAYVAVVAITVFNAADFTLWLKELLKWVEMALIVLLVVDLGREAANGRKWLGWLLALALVAGLWQALVGVWQFALRGTGPDHFLVLGRFYRAYGSFVQPNPYGGFVGLNGAVALGGCLGFLSGGKLRHPLFWLLSAAAVCLALGVVASWSRGAWLGFAAALGVIGLFWPRQGWRGVAVAAVALLLLLGGWQFGLVPAAVTARVSTIGADFRLGDVRGVDVTDANYAVLERLAFWQAAVEMARYHPWLGVGFGNYAAAYPAFALINWPQPLGHAHNYYLNLLAETGVVGLVAYGMLWAAVFGHCLWLLRRLAWPLRGVALGLLGAWVMLSVHQLVDKLYVNNLYVHVGVLLGVQQLLAYERPQSKETEV